MSSVGTDQADGLRRLMAGSSGRRVAVVGCTTADVAMFTRNLAAALLQEGREVVLLDEHNDTRARWPAGEGQVVLVHAALGTDGALSPLAAHADHILVVVQAHAASITASYACIRALCGNHALQRLRVLVENAANAADAQRILSNLADAARRYLSLAIDPAGWVRADPHLARSSRLNATVVDAFRNSPAAADYRHVACGLLSWPQGRPGEPVPAGGVAPRESVLH